MDLAALYHHGTDAVLTLTGMSDKEAHINAGLLIYVGAQCMLRTRRASLQALMAVLACEGANEILDYLFFGDARWADTLGDIGATLAWPVVLFTVSRYRRRRWAFETARPVSRRRGAARPFAALGHQRLPSRA
ncbi:MAG: hypothetical protein WC816_00230 [Sphingomonas sp.]|jgi:hypothetical protein